MLAQQLKGYEKSFNEITLRERAMIVVSVLAIVGYLWWTYFAETNQSQIKQLVQDNKKIEQEIKSSTQTLTTLNNALEKGIKNEKRERLEKLKEIVDNLDKELKARTVELIDPDEMFKLLSSLVYKQSKLKLMGLKRLSVKPAIPVETVKATKVKSTDEEQLAEAKIYRHVMQISLSGKFTDILKYLNQLENLDWKLIWDSFVLNRNDKNELVVTIELSTLSGQSNWVGI